MAEQKKRTKEQRKARRKVMEPSTLKKKIEQLETEKLALEVRIGELEACYAPIVHQSLRFASAFLGVNDERKASISIRLKDLKKLRQVVSGATTRSKDDYPDFATTARHTIQDLGSSLLDIGTLAEEMQIAYEAGYEHRRTQELARARGEQVDGE